MDNDMIDKIRRLGLWAEKKIEVETKTKPRTFLEGEIFWAVLGENIGVEVYGKGNDFLRPVVILHKYNRDSLFVVPLTSQDQTSRWCVPFNHRGLKEYTLLSQSRMISVKRLRRKMGRIDDTDYRRIRNTLVLQLLGRSERRKMSERLMIYLLKKSIQD
ncbi:type II toxin-antitoxin system PemK/MazF family toxin [Candidatus Saccharibacteria bacterium]|nr:type II toxin-antitoxin system PemK/MazF family toxin [Candidatus Saccharibacteria bacterium]